MIAENIKRIRTERGISPERLGLSIGKDRATIYNWESGKTSPPAALLADIARELNCTITDLLEERTQA